MGLRLVFARSRRRKRSIEFERLVFNDLEIAHCGGSFFFYALFA